jgi:hypothetical protein
MLTGMIAVQSKIAWSEVIGYSTEAPGSLVPYNPNKPETVKHYRRILFQPKWIQPKVSTDMLVKGL